MQNSTIFTSSATAIIPNSTIIAHNLASSTAVTPNLATEITQQSTPLKSYSSAITQNSTTNTPYQHYSY